MAYMDLHSTPPDETDLALENSHSPATGKYSVVESLVDRFRRVAERHPDRKAAVCGDSSLSYGELDTLSDRLAAQLRARGIAHEELLGICLERSVEMVVATLAVLKAGGAYLPLDPTNPSKRLALILTESETRLVLTHSRLRHLVEGGGREILCLDLPESLDSADEYSGEELKSEARPDDLAYVIYTSGSTGTPKGVEVTHANVVRLFDATEEWFHFGPEDVWSMFHSYAFDFSVWEMWGALLYGGKLAIVPYDVSRTPKAFYEFLVKEGVTILNQTPSAFRQLIQAEAATGGIHPDLKLRTVVFGGEALELVSLEPWIESHGDAQPELINMYGITETTVHVTYRRIRLQDVEEGRGSVIGVPIPDLEVRLLDSDLQPLDVGVEGEIYVGGAGVARGYRNQEELTAERFIEDPLEKDGRLYRSGDLARFTADGDMEYLGRADLQVKIRGFRIELGEIEAALRGQPSIEDAVVIDREDVPGDKRLVAYLICPDPANVDLGRLREALRQVLPEYMVPSGYVFMEVLPLNHNGKLDRKALPRPTYESSEAYAVPRTEAEWAIAEIWRKSLGDERVGLDDNFFDLGGHSLLGVEVANGINDRLGCDLSVIEFFDRPTIRELCALLEEEATLGEDQGTTSDGAHPAPEIDTTEHRADLDQVEKALAELQRNHSGRHEDRMRESLFCRWVLAPLYGFCGRWLRSLLQTVILRLEGGAMFSKTMRMLYRKHFDMEIGYYSSFCFDSGQFKCGTSFGRYCSVMGTARFETANHPSNTISSHGVFYQKALGFSPGVDIPRTRIEVGHDVHIGHNVTVVYPARRIGDGAIIGAGSLVTEDVPPYAIVAGYPARIIRYRFSEETRRKLQELRWWDAPLGGLEQVRDEFMRPLDGKQVR